MTPTCPMGYDCTFKPRDLDPHYYAHWWDGPAGIVVAIVALVALCVIVATVAYWWHELRSKQMDRKAAQENRVNQLAIEEQRTMQLDAAKGDPEMLKIVRSMQR